MSAGDSRSAAHACAERHASSDADETPLVSVIIPVCNDQATLERALASLKGQTYARLEVIVVDDGSVDPVAVSGALVAGLNLKLRRLARSLGAGAARNEGLKHATGSFVAFLDADDEWHPEKTVVQVKALLAGPDLAFSHTGVRAIVDGRDTGMLQEVAGVRAEGRDAWKTLLKHGCVVTSSVMLRRSRYDASGGFDVRLPVGEDQDLWIRLALKAEVHHEPRILVDKHDRRSSMMHKQRRLIADVTLPMIVSHIESLDARLSPAEKADILGYRRLVAGRNAYEAGDLLKGARFVLGSRHGPLRGRLWYLFSASPVGRAVKRSRGVRSNV